jgi:serine/threonine-protein phosphatase 2A regulatory subunit A
VNEVHQKELRKAYGGLCSDETPMVRRAAATHLRALIDVIETTQDLIEMVPVYKVGWKWK